MENEFVSEINTGIAEITEKNIMSHIDNGDLSEWLEGWRIEMAGNIIGVLVQLQFTEEVTGKMKDIAELVVHGRRK